MTKFKQAKDSQEVGMKRTRKDHRRDAGQDPRPIEHVFDLRTIKSSIVGDLDGTPRMLARSCGKMSSARLELLWIVKSATDSISVNARVVILALSWNEALVALVP
jgi:hypothetical protein